MATISPTILKHNKKADGTWNVVFRITHRQQSAYIKTTHFVSKEQLDKKLKLRNNYIMDFLSSELKEYRKRISALSIAVDRMSAAEIKERITESNSAINFMQFCKDYQKDLEAKGQKSAAIAVNTCVFSLMDYFRRDNVPVSEINKSMILKFENYLMSERKFQRPSSSKIRPKLLNVTKPGLSKQGAEFRIKVLRRIFEACKEKYNNEDLGIIRIPQSPFSTYKYTNRMDTRKRNLPLDTIRGIRDLPLKENSLLALVRDLMMFSFYMCGMNAVDMYAAPSEKNGRIEYYRTKTRTKRRDQAFISIKIPDEARPLLPVMHSLKTRYKTNTILNSMLSKGTKMLGVVLSDHGIHIDDLTFYHMRHSFATIARNDCRFPKDDVAMALNHIDPTRRVTDTYIAPDWSIIDDVQEGVLKLLRGNEDNS